MRGREFRSGSRGVGVGDCWGAGPRQRRYDFAISGGVWRDGCGCYARNRRSVVAEGVACFGGFGVASAAAARHVRADSVDPTARLEKKNHYAGLAGTQGIEAT